MSARRADLLLTLSAVAGAAVVLGALAMMLSHSRLLVVRTGSMSPTLPVGAVALLHTVPADEIVEGDIVTVPLQGSSANAVVTHRVVQATHGAGRVTLLLKGDANPVSDPDLVEVASAPRLVGHLPGLGYAAALLHRAGPLLGLAYLGWLGWIVSRVRRPGRAGSNRQRRRTSRPDGAVARRAAGRVLLGLAVVVLAAAPTQAAGWADTNPVTSAASASTAVVPPSTSFVCSSLGVLAVGFAWTPVAGATSYDLHWGRDGASVLAVTGTSYTFNSALAGGTAWVQANVAFPSTTWTSAPSTKRNYSVAVASTCQ